MTNQTSGQRGMLTDDQLLKWASDGFLHVPGFITGDDLDHLTAVVDDLGQLADGERGLLQHYEKTDEGVRICRSEHLIDAHPMLKQLFVDGDLVVMAGELLGEPAVLYKEKVNYKLPGGAGFAPHQDAPAYPFIDTHTTCMVAIDDATLENGCLDVVAQMHGEVLPVDEAGCIRPSLVESMPWQPMPIAAGDLLWFHSRAPHRSGPNVSPHQRRAFFCTYNARSHGDLRDRYYAEKLAVFSAGPEGEATRVSLIGDFQGRAPSAAEIADYEQAKRR